MIEILCNGVSVKGFSSVNIVKGIDQIAATYSFGVFRDNSDSAWIPVYPGDEVMITIDGEAVLDGYNISTSPSFNAGGIGCQVTGMEKTCDLIDCTTKTIDFDGKSVSDIVKNVCDDFGIRYAGSGDTDIGAPLKKFSTDVGMTAFNVIVNACKERNVYPTSDGIGNVSIIGTSYDAAEVDLVQGENVLSVKGLFSVADRFSKYTIIASSDPKCKTFATMEDEGVSRTRELVILDERYSTKEGCESKALWEARHRQAKGNSMSVVVDGWRQKVDGSLWKTGLLVNCDIPSILAEPRSFLINSVNFVYGNQGTQTILNLVDEDTYLPNPKIAPKGKLKPKKTDIWASVRKQTGSKL